MRDHAAIQIHTGGISTRTATRPRPPVPRPHPGCAFDLVHQEDDLTGWPYARRRAALEALFAERGLTAPWLLCPSTTDPVLAREWLSWTAAGVEGRVGNTEHLGGTRPALTLAWHYARPPWGRR
ncbi:hypothetical protein OG604_01895 [Streptomyces sp. NBC_01231]|nr:hypothetical protein OG604_01895 [Streptomyces sp. NBC_01231]